MAVNIGARFKLVHNVNKAIVVSVNKANVVSVNKAIVVSVNKANVVGANVVGANVVSVNKANVVGTNVVGANVVGANTNTYTTPPTIIPKKIFIIPYRNRANQKSEFLKHMKEIILLDEPVDSYQIYFAHQDDIRPFNRGAMKNIGFLAMKQKYPLDYKNITFIFHDVDTMPSAKDMIDYETKHGSIKHYYGYEFALGGIFAIKGEDFERSLGFPNFGGWGLEDNVIQERSLKVGLLIDRSQFYQMRDPRIIRAFDGYDRLISKRDTVVYKRETPDDLVKLRNVKWTIINEFINISHFDCGMDPRQQEYATHDIRKGNKMLVPQGYNRRVWKLKPTTTF